MHLRLNNQRGDTLIEVTLAVAILATVLASAYAVTSRAAKSGQAAKERSQAVALVQQQAEIIQSFAILDWDEFISDFKPWNSGRNHYDPSSWSAKPNMWTGTAVSNAAADFRVYYQATCSTSRLGMPGDSCSVSTDKINKVSFEITADWVPSDGDGTRQSTTIVVQVSPSRVK
ncbi:prepilin-type N-terminal cleavage/methylation domain-containing protein [Candidatus Saccharibacteria bacterium]|jgi:prepilin-type N-terminal cleavage/methylation domain-containing protein|nr:prepilin-type N-terminal cleavage/methylation domain-containing protein [Candidatus Saccharibacteria bacterium]MBP9131516.1 prepilin-type N-terminal cleavage/methylation domain-containing protein [Candidatus Saccharibacteria bacterium]